MKLPFHCVTYTYLQCKDTAPFGMHMADHPSTKTTGMINVRQKQVDPLDWFPVRFPVLADSSSIVERDSFLA